MTDEAQGDRRPHTTTSRVTMMFHPSHHVPDLGEAEAWFEHVFARVSTSLASMARDAPPRPGYPVDYSTFTPISDVLFDTIDPKRYLVLGQQLYASVETPTLKAIGWYVEDMTGLYRELRARDIRVVDQYNNIAEGDDPPTAPGSQMPLFFTHPDDAGLRYELFPAMPFPLDPRLRPGWKLPPASADDPLGIERCSHHTIVTSQPQRAMVFAVDTLGGAVVHQGRNDVIGATSTHVKLAGSVLEYAIPDRDTRAHAALTTNDPRDVYYSITWKVQDLDAAAAHLQASGVVILTSTDDTLVTDPATSLGIPWGFTTASIPGSGV